MDNSLLSFFFIFGIPLVSIGIAKRLSRALPLSCVMGSLLLVTWMIYQEAIASDSDLDFVFLISLVLWAFILSLIYALLFFVLSLLCSPFKK